VGLTWHDIDALYVSHAHADHVGGIEEFAFSRMFIPPKSKPTICGEQGHAQRPVGSHPQRGPRSRTGDKRFRLNSYFDPIYVELHGPTRGFTWQRMWFRLIEMPHIMPSYGVYFETPSTQSHPYGRGVLYTSDTSAVVRPSDPMDDFYRRASIIFQDCETAPYKSGVHTHYSDLRTLPDDLKRKMWLYHYQDALPLPDAKADGFAGFVTKGQTFDF
jgi:ribonuclease BN (tRNA processing enzyme)